MKNLLIILFCCLTAICRGQYLTGYVVALPDSTGIEDVTIDVLGASYQSKSLKNGIFQVQVPSGLYKIRFSKLGYEQVDIQYSTETDKDEILVVLRPVIRQLETVDVLSTGYYTVPKERATGSFDFIDNKLLNRSVGANLIHRLEGVTNGLYFDKRLSSGTDKESKLSLRLRGVSSLTAGNEPLIVLDGFPYEGNIDQINPNDIDNISILKDAAAASIWGAKAGNGVIVITTKNGGRSSKAQIDFNVNTTIFGKPDLTYNPAFLGSSEYITLENSFFNNGFYDAAEKNAAKPLLSDAVLLLFKHKRGQINDEQLSKELDQLSQRDIRQDASRYLFRRMVNDQYNLSIKGGGNHSYFYLSGGFDKSRKYTPGISSDRVTLMSNLGIDLTNKLELKVNWAFNKLISINNGIDYDRVIQRLPYAQLVDEHGLPAAIPNGYNMDYIREWNAGGRLDWSYKPLLERDQYDRKGSEMQIRVNPILTYRLTGFLTAAVSYQYLNDQNKNRLLRRPDSYYVRNLVNRFTQVDGTQIFPNGGILRNDRDEDISHTARLQINMNKSWGDHDLVALAGHELRQFRRLGGTDELYGFDEDVYISQGRLDYLTRYKTNPSGTAQITAPANGISDEVDRYVSYFANANYSFRRRYNVSGSVRWDASNLFGVKTNQKGTPLWSAGLSWRMDEEPFFQPFQLPLIRWRFTYGINGNVNKQASAYPIASYNTDLLTGLPNAQIRTYPNPQLRWERVEIFNAALEIGQRSHRVSGTLEYYRKSSKDVLALTPPLDPTTGYNSMVLNSNYYVNYAHINGNGIDVTLNLRNPIGQSMLETNILMNMNKNKVTKYLTGQSYSLNAYLNGTNFNPPMEGRSLDGIYSFPWYGLDANTGSPLAMMDENLVIDRYAEVINKMRVEDLVYHGLSVPPIYGSIRNTWTWNGWSFSANILWKSNYYYRRNSIDYVAFASSGVAHRDAAARWQQPGDERWTNVPSAPTKTVANRDQYYMGSEILVERADHIRLKDISLSYDFKKMNIKGIGHIRVYFYANDLGIIWKRSKVNLDPEYPLASILPSRSFSVGLNMNFK
ncbi:SusC/RagA family TonB-linked outer membrane protein [Sphingobacterium thalpophilum]|uniref:SusC/RagA family TonB-linked outer membrane protein n=1 Tax=Sphingobacterium thalpophilum TaxID=259 RepID=A0ABV4HB68_9SPHI